MSTLEKVWDMWVQRSAENTRKAFWQVLAFAASVVAVLLWEAWERAHLAHLVPTVLIVLGLCVLVNAFWTLAMLFLTANKVFQLLPLVNLATQLSTDASSVSLEEMALTTLLTLLPFEPTQRALKSLFASPKLVSLGVDIALRVATQHVLTDIDNFSVTGTVKPVVVRKLLILALHLRLESLMWNKEFLANLVTYLAAAPGPTISVDTIVATGVATGAAARLLASSSCLIRPHLFFAADVMLTKLPSAYAVSCVLGLRYIMLFVMSMRLRRFGFPAEYFLAVLLLLVADISMMAARHAKNRTDFAVYVFTGSDKELFASASEYAQRAAGVVRSWFVRQPVPPPAPAPQ
jgi:hypothetical protein